MKIMKQKIKTQQKKSMFTKWGIVLFLMSFFLFTLNTSTFGGIITGDPINSERNWGYIKMMNTDMEYLLNIPDYNDIIIAIVDTGIDYTHEAFADVRWWVNENETLNGLDDDGNGYIDDGLIGGGYDFGYMDNDPMPILNGHGTNMAGVMVAKNIVADPERKLSKQGGIFQNAIIMNLKWQHEISMNAIFGGEAKAIRYAVDNGARVINCSFNESSTDFIAALEYAITNNVIVVASVGNSGTYKETGDHYPSTYEGVIGIGAVTEEADISILSNYGPDVDFMMYSQFVSTLGPGDTYSTTTGTSISTAQMSALIGRLLSYDPSMTRDDVYALLAAHSIPIDHEDTGHGRIDYKGLVQSLMDINTTYVDTTINEEPAVLEIIEASHSGGFNRTTLRSLYYKDQRYFMNLEIE